MLSEPGAAFGSGTTGHAVKPSRINIVDHRGGCLCFGFGGELRRCGNYRELVSVVST